MIDKVRCNCRRCTIRGLMGPAIIITIGILFLLSETRGNDYEFWRMSPVILIVVGLMSLASSLAPMDGHISPTNPPVVAPAAPSSAPNPPSQDPFAGQGQ
jgi:hypothetical protein